MGDVRWTIAGPRCVSPEVSRPVNMVPIRRTCGRNDLQGLATLLLNQVPVAT